MSNTYTQIHIQAVFAVRYRRSLIQPHFKNELYKYICGIINRNGHKTLSINGMPDHVHVLFGMRPSQSLSDLMQDVKGDSSKCPPAGRQGSMTEALVKGNFHGSQDMEDFHIASPKYPTSSGILKTRRFIIEGKHFLKNTRNFYSVSKSNMMNATFSNH